MTAPAGASTFSTPERHSEGTTIMTDQPARVTPAKISALLDHARQLSPAAPLAEQIAYHQRKASLLSRVAADLDTAEAHLVAAEAWHYADPGRPPRRRQPGGGAAVKKMWTFSGDQIAQVNNPDPVRGAGVALPGVPHARLGNHHRPTGPGHPGLGRVPGPPPAGHPDRRGAGAGLAAVRLAWPGHPGRLDRGGAGGVVVAVASSFRRHVLGRVRGNGGAGTTSGTGPRS